MPQTPKKVTKRKPGGRSSLSRVFAEAIDDGIAQVRGDYDNDIEDEDDEEELDEEAYEYTVEAKQQRLQREADKQRALKLHDLVDEVYELNRTLTDLEASMIDTPAADEYADVQSIDEPAFEHASRRLAGELEQIRKALKKAEEEQEERKAANERGRKIRERIAALRIEQQELSDLWELQGPDTPCADEFENCEGLTQERFGQADAALRGEEQAVHRLLEQRRLQDQLSQLRAVEAQGRAKALRQAVDDYYVVRRQLENRAAELGLAMVGEPLAFAEYRANGLGQKKFDELKRLLTVAKLGAELRLQLLSGRANWSAQGMTKLDGAALLAFDALQAAVDANDGEGSYSTLANDLVNHVETLRAHAAQRAIDIPKEELDEDIQAFYDSYNEGADQPKDVFKQTMEEFARQYEHPPGKWKEYQKLYNVLKSAERARNVVAVPVDGRLPVTRLRRVLPSGTTAGQWYTNDQSFDSGAGQPYAYHLSVAFSLEPVRGKSVQMARITGIHASFKRGTTDCKYWWNVNGATVTANGTSGGAALNTTMHTRATTLLNGMKPRLNLL